MKLHEALASGRPFRTKGSEGGWMPASEDSLGWTFTTTEILDYEWELKPEAREWDMWMSHDGALISLVEGMVGWKKIRVREIINEH